MKLSSILKILIIVLILIFYVSVLFHKINLPTDDLGRHLKNGEIIWQTKSIAKTNLYSYVEPNFPFLNHHWLSGLIFYFLFQTIGFSGLVIFKTALLLAALFLVLLLGMKKGDFWIATLGSLPTIFILSERTDVRPEIFSYFFTALFLYFLVCFADNPQSKKIFWLIPLQLLWVNLHIYFFVGIAMAGGFLFEQIIKILEFKNDQKFILRACRGDKFLARIINYCSRQTRTIIYSFMRGFKNNLLVKKLVIVFFSLIAVSLVNPAGYKTLFYPFNIFKNYGYDIVENKSPLFLENLMHDSAIPAFKIMVVLLALSFVFGLKKRPIFFFLVATATAVASFLAIRNFPFFALISLPVASLNFEDFVAKAGIWLKTKKQKEFLISQKILPFALMLLFLILTVLSAKAQILKNKERGLGLTYQSNDSSDFFKQQNLTGPIFNNYDIGSYLIFHLFSREKVFVDNRPEAYPKEFFTDTYIPMQTKEEVWLQQEEKYNFNTIFFTAQEGTWWGRAFLYSRLADPQWGLVFADSQAIILLRNTTQNQKIIKKFQITKDNIAQKIDYLANSSDVKLKMAAVNLFQLTGQDDLALKILKEIIEKNPRESRAWLEKGYIESKQNDLENLISATHSLEKAIDLGENFPNAYNQLGLIYFRLNWFEKARETWQRTLKINPRDQNAREYLKQYQELNLP